MTGTSAVPGSPTGTAATGSSPRSPGTPLASASRGSPPVAPTVAELPPGLHEHQVVARAAARGVTVEGLGEYALGDHTRGAGLVIGYAAPPPARLRHRPRPAQRGDPGLASPRSPYRWLFILRENGPCFLT